MPSRSSTSSRSQSRRGLHTDSTDDNEEVWDVASSSSSPSSSRSHTSSSSEDDGLVSKLPTLPDLRFEQSYLATIRGFLHEEHPSSSSSQDDGELSEFVDEKQEVKDHHHKVEITRSKAKNEHELWLGNLRVEWFPILYVTVRDQLISPLVQGAVWGLGGLLFSQIRQYMSATRARNVANAKANGSNGSILRSLGLSKK